MFVSLSVLFLGLVLGTIQQPPPPPPNQLFQIFCDEAVIYGPPNNPGVQALLQQFQAHAPPGFRATLAVPQIFAGVNAHRVTVHYESANVRQCEDIKYVLQCMNMYKPQNAVVAQVCVIPGGYAVTYYKYCACQRRTRQRRQDSYFMDDPYGFFSLDYFKKKKKDTVQKYRGEGSHAAINNNHFENTIEKPPPPVSFKLRNMCPLQCPI